MDGDDNNGARKRPRQLQLDAAPEMPPPPVLAIRLPHVPTEVSFSGRLEDDYVVGPELGHGTYSTVRSAVHRATGAARAVKIIDTRRFRLGTSFRRENVLDEVRIMRALSPGPGIIGVHEVYEGLFNNFEALMIVMDRAPGGELFDSIINRGNFSEAQARWVLWQLLRALEHLHSRGVVHRDVKPENVLVFATERFRDGAYPPDDEPTATDAVRELASEPELVPMLRVKLADFGVARYVGASAYTAGASTFVGSPQYVAPEVLFSRDSKSRVSRDNTTYGRAVDVYSLGVLAYVMLAGYLPFDDGAPVPPNVTQSRATNWEDRVKTGDYHFAPPVWTHVSAVARDLIASMLIVDPRARITVAAALLHPYFDPIRSFRAASAGAAVGSDGRETPPAPSFLGSFAALRMGSPVREAPAWPERTGLSRANTETSGGSSGGGGTTAAIVVPRATRTVAAGLAAAFPTISSESFSSADVHIDATTTAATPPEPLALTSTSPPLSPTSLEQQKRTLLAISKSVDFSRLLKMQHSLALTLRSAYFSMSDEPKAAGVVKHHAVIVRELQHRARNAVGACRTAALSILNILPDLAQAVREHDVVYGHAIFNQLKGWVTSLKGQASDMQSAYSAVILEIQTSLENARALNLHYHTHDFDPAAMSVSGRGGLDDAAMADALPAAAPSPLDEHHDTRGLSPTGSARDEAILELFGIDVSASLSLSETRLRRLISASGGGAGSDGGALATARGATPSATPSSGEGGGVANAPAHSAVLVAQRPPTKCLGCALAELAAVDSLLMGAIEFWSSMELVIDVILRRKEHAETHLSSASASAAFKALSKLSDFSAFWSAFALLCREYGDALDSDELSGIYSWLSEVSPGPGPSRGLLIAAGGRDLSER